MLQELVFESLHSQGLLVRLTPRQVWPWQIWTWPETLHVLGKLLLGHCFVLALSYFQTICSINKIQCFSPLSLCFPLLVSRLFWNPCALDPLPLIRARSGSVTDHVRMSYRWARKTCKIPISRYRCVNEEKWLFPRGAKSLRDQVPNRFSKGDRKEHARP